MFFTPPDLLVVLLTLGLFLILGALTLGSGEASAAAAHCPHDGCGHVNPAQARFCGHCGRVLPNSRLAR